MILGHHYQRDEVIAYADIRGDSFKLAQAAADNPSAEFIFFCHKRNIVRFRLFFYRS